MMILLGLMLIFPFSTFAGIPVLIDSTLFSQDQIDVQLSYMRLLKNFPELELRKFNRAVSDKEFYTELEEKISEERFDLGFLFSNHVIHSSGNMGYIPVATLRPKRKECMHARFFLGQKKELFTGVSDLAGKKVGALHPRMQGPSLKLLEASGNVSFTYGKPSELLKFLNSGLLNYFITDGIFYGKDESIFLFQQEVKKGTLHLLHFELSGIPCALAMKKINSTIDSKVFDRMERHFREDSRTNIDFVPLSPSDQKSLLQKIKLIRNQRR